MTRLAPTREAPSEEQGALGPYLRAITANWLLVVGLTVATVAASCTWLLLRSPTYEAKAQLLVTPVSQDDTIFLGVPVLRESSEPTRTMQTAAELVSTRQAARVTAAALGPDWAVDRVEDSVAVEPQGESDILAVTAEDEDAGAAARLANEYAEAALDTRHRALRRQAAAAIAQLRAREAGPEDRSERLSQLQLVRRGIDPTLSLAERASVPNAPLGAPTWLVVVLSALAGFVLACVAALVPQPK